MRMAFSEIIAVLSWSQKGLQWEEDSQWLSIRFFYFTVKIVKHICDIGLSGLQMTNILLAKSGTSTEMFLLMCTVPYQINQSKKCLEKKR